jgi:hypothetical protein
MEGAAEVTERAARYEMDAVDEILLDWYEWSQAYGPALGYRGAAPESRGFRISRQWMTASERDDEVDAELLDEVGKAVEPFVFQLSVAHRIAVQAEMMNLQVGAAVWRSARAGTYEEAKAILKPILAAHGILRKDVATQKRV